MIDSLYEILWTFILYSFLGWCVEVSFAAATLGKFVNRGFLQGPFCPIYGFGVTSVILALTPFKNNIFILFILSVILTSVLEFITGFMLEKLFNLKWWDYSNMKFNIKGYISLYFSLIWGVSCVIVIYIIHPLILALINIIPKFIGTIFLAVIFLIIAADVTVTIIEILKFKKNLKIIKEIENKMVLISDTIGQNISEQVIKVKKHSINELAELKNKYENILKEDSHLFNRLSIAFPKLQKLRDNLDNLIEKNNKDQKD